MATASGTGNTGVRDYTTTSDAGATTSANPLRWTLKTETVDAFYHGTGSTYASSFNTYDVGTDQSSATLANINFLAAQGSVNYGTSGTTPLTLALTQQLAKITVNLTGDTTYPNDLTVTIGNGNLITNGTFSFSTATYHWSGTANSSIVMHRDALSGSTASFSARIIPQAVASNTSQFVTVTNGSVVAKYKLTSAASFLPGYSYTLALTQNMEIIITNITLDNDPIGSESTSGATDNSDVGVTGFTLNNDVSNGGTTSGGTIEI